MEAQNSCLWVIISGGIQTYYVKNEKSFKLLVTTRDDACAKLNDKVARILGLPYPGGPHIARLAEASRKKCQKYRQIQTPPPHDQFPGLAFSFAGLKNRSALP